MSEAQKQRARELLWMLGFDGKSVSNGHGTNYIYILTGGIHKNVIAYILLNWIFLLLQRFFKDFIFIGCCNTEHHASTTLIQQLV